jgi:hypothetical protein
MITIKKFLRTVMVGGLLGAALFAWFSPVFIKWYGTPPVSTGINCEPMIGWTIDAYRVAILIGLGVGVVFSALAYVAFIGKSKAPAVAGPADPLK